MTRKDDGYATATVLGLLAVLSLIASWGLTLAMSQNQLVNAKVEAVKLDYAMENYIWEEIEGLISQPKSLQLRSDIFELNHTRVVMERSDEQSRPDFRRLSKQDLRIHLERLLPPNSPVDLILSRREELLIEDDQLRQLENFDVYDDLDPVISACLAERFTIYTSTINPLTKQTPDFLGGGIVRLSFRTLKGENPPRYVRAVILFTGDQKNPFFILDWTNGHDAAPPNCAAPI